MMNEGLSWEVAFVLVVVVGGKQLKGDEQAYGVQPVGLSPIDFGVGNKFLQNR